MTDTIKDTSHMYTIKLIGAHGPGAIRITENDLVNVRHYKDAARYNRDQCKVLESEVERLKDQSERRRKTIGERQDKIDALERKLASYSNYLIPN
jgi:predicted RNase H-like nuclease (RuvC/YqgF family)